jgi:hypothetical protein
MKILPLPVAILSVSCACAWICETSTVNIHCTLASDGVTVVSALFAIILTHSRLTRLVRHPNPYSLTANS